MLNYAPVNHQQEPKRKMNIGANDSFDSTNGSFNTQQETLSLAIFQFYIEDSF